MSERNADPIDQASYQEEQTKALRLRQIREQANKPIVLTGYCLECGETLTDRRWCDADCRDLWSGKNE